MIRDDQAEGSGSPRARQDFRPGHAVHWIQARKASEAADGEVGRIVAVTTREVVVELEGRRRCYVVADTNRVRDLIERHGAKVTAQEQWSLLRLHNHLVSIGILRP